MKNTLFLLVTICFTHISSAQLFEIGGFVGGSNYVGEVGPTTFLRPNKIGFGGIFKYNYTTRIAFRTTVSKLPIYAKDADSKNPIRRANNTSIKNDITEFTLGIEFNFFDYNIADWRINHTPYFVFETALFSYKKALNKSDINEINYANEFGIAIPFGIGYKAKLVDKLAFALETRVRYTLTDFIDNGDVVNNIYNNDKNNDWYFFTGFSLVYTFGRPPCYHPNNR
jgi:hypothetical protein